MAWGRAGGSQGLDDLCSRLRANDPTLSSLTILKHRRFDDNEVRKLCDAMASNTSLTELYASNHAMSAATAQALAAMLASNTTLRTLCVGDATFGDAGVAALAPGLTASTSLQSLDLESKAITASGASILADVLSDSASLTALNLARNPLTDNGAAALSRRPWCSLQQLDLRNCDMGMACAAGLAGPEDGGYLCPLVCLDLSGNCMGGSAGPHIAQLLHKCPKLRELRVHNCGLRDVGVAQLAPAVSTHASLQLLDVSCNAAGATAACALADALGSNTCLTSLNLGDNRDMTANDVNVLAAAVSGNKSSALTHIDFTNASLQGDQCAAMLTAMSNCSWRRVCLLGTGLGNEGCMHMLACLRSGGFPVIEELSISGCGVEWADGLEPLFEWLMTDEGPQLRVLECGANPACQHDAVADKVLMLRASRPQLQVHWNAADQANQAEGAASERATNA